MMLGHSIISIVCNFIYKIRGYPKAINMFRNSEDLFLVNGGEGGIRTLEAFRLTHFPGVLLRPLGHLTKIFFILPISRLLHSYAANAKTLILLFL